MEMDGVEIQHVFKVLLAGGVWHEIEQGSFRVLEAEDAWYDDMNPIFLDASQKGVLMFSCVEEDDGIRTILKGPLSSILAVGERIYT